MGKVVHHDKLPIGSMEARWSVYINEALLHAIAMHVASCLIETSIAAAWFILYFGNDSMSKIFHG